MHEACIATTACSATRAEGAASEEARVSVSDLLVLLDLYRGNSTPKRVTAERGSGQHRVLEALSDIGVVEIIRTEAQHSIVGLTSAGRVVVQRLIACAEATLAESDEKPEWRAAERQLWCGGQLLRAFGRTAPNQELLLKAFEESEWVSRIDDPLPPTKDIDSATRLHDAIKCLNRSLLVPLIRFRGDGTGLGVCWSYSVTPDSRLRTPDSGLRTPDSRLRTPDSGRKTEDGRRKTKDGRRKTEDNSRFQPMRPRAPLFWPRISRKMLTSRALLCV